MANRFKFRVWDKEEKRFRKDTQNFLIDTDGNLRFWDGDFLYIDHVDIKYEVMQSTGFTDCNGKEIFEGDINEHGFVVSWVGDTGESLGMNSGWYLQRDNFESWTELECRSEEHKIIGNIYENPELLKE